MVEHKNKQKLKINPEPFKSSHLAIPPSPFSPRTPLALAPYNPPRRTKYYPAPDTSSLPPSPLQWLWQCHQCRRTYSLGVTRRCLEDGHTFCAGTTTVKTWRKPIRVGKMKRHRACASEFDYQGWKTWGRWRRSGRRDSIYDDSSSSTDSDSSSSEEDSTESEFASEAATKSEASDSSKDCWNTCDYPSECRWGKRFGVHTPVATEFPTITINTTPPPPPPSTTFEGILKPENCKEVNKDKKVDKTDFWSALMASATRRKSITPSSPLATVAEEPEPGDSPKDQDGDVVMTTIDPALLSQQPTPAPTLSSASVTAALNASAPIVSLKEIIRKGSKRVAKTEKPAETKVPRKPDFLLTIPEQDALFDEIDLEEESHQILLSDLAPLTRVKSRDSGYHSIPDVS